MVVEFIQPLVVIVYLSILSFLDFKSYKKRKGYIPAIATSSFVLLAFIMSQNYWVGILAALLGIVFADLGLWEGIADYKIFVAMGLLVGSLFQFCIFVGSLIVVVWVIHLWKILVIHKKTGYYPFIPVIAISYIIQQIISIFLH